MNLQATDFALFGLPQRFALERAVLDARWKALQREAHPDQHAASDAALQRQAVQWSARINEAYLRLKDPVRRAAYLCELGGRPVDTHTNTAMPASFLMEQMAWREALEDTDDDASLQSLESEVQRSRAALLAQCAEQIDDEADYAGAAQTVRALMFVERFARDLDHKRDALEGLAT